MIDTTKALREARMNLNAARCEIGEADNRLCQLLAEEPEAPKTEPLSDVFNRETIRSLTNEVAALKSSVNAFRTENTAIKKRLAEAVAMARDVISQFAYVDGRGGEEEHREDVAIVCRSVLNEWLQKLDALEREEWH